MTKLFKFFNKVEQNFHLGKATAIIAILTLVSRLMGFVRDLFLASQLGANIQTDIYFTAFRIPDLIYNLLILGTLSAAFIPVFTDYYLKNKTEAWKIANSVLNLGIILVGGLSVIIFIFAKPLVSIVAPGFNEAALDQTASLTRIFLLSPIIFTISSVFSSTLISFKKFIWVNTAPLFYNAGIIIGIIFFWPMWGLTGVALGVILGAILHALIQLPQLIGLGFQWRPIIAWKNTGVKKVVSLFLPRVLGLDISYVNLIIVSIVGSTLVSGTISAFNFANNIQSVPLGIFAISTTLAVFPVLSEEYAKKQYNSFINTFNRAFVRILFFILPLSILMLLLRAHVVRLLLGYGACDWTCTITTFDALGLLSISLVAQSLVPLLSRAFYARQNTKIPLFISLAAMAINGILSWQLAYGLGIIGIALGFVIASAFQLILLMIYLHKEIQYDLKSNKIIRESDYYIVSSSTKIMISAMVSGLVAYGLLYGIALFVNTHTVLGILIQAGFAGMAAVFVYLILTMWFHIPEAISIKSALSRTTKFFNVSSVQ